MSERDVVIVGAGPAGMLLAFLFARQGIRVTLLESQADFERKFRGDTFHSPAMDVMEDLGLAEECEALCHSKLSQLRLVTDTQSIPFVDFSLVSGTRYPWVGLIPQSKWLTWLAAKAEAYPAFELRMNSPVRELIEDDHHRVCGVRLKGGEELRATLVVGADGRGSRVRREAVLPLHPFGSEMDLVWFELPCGDGDARIDPLAVRFSRGHMLICVNRGDYWQLGYIILKGSVKEVRDDGLAAFREQIARLQPGLADRVDHLTDWKQTAILSVQTGRVARWWTAGCLLIGDAAHVMSPVGGVGINYALMDAVAAANALTDPLREGYFEDGHLAEVQRRREPPTQLIQLIQAQIQHRVIRLALKDRDFRLPPFFSLIRALPFVRRLPGTLIARGLWAERVRHREARP